MRIVLSSVGVTDMIYGVDGCSGGWVAAQSEYSLQDIRFEVFPTFAALLGAAADSYVAIDIPIGLPIDSARACDRAARSLLGRPRQSSVFPPPARVTINASNYRDACLINSEALHKAISRQAFGIMPKIREVDLVMTPELQTRIREVHPEVSFASLNANTPMIGNKKKAPGRAERIAVLNTHGLEVSETWLMSERTHLGTSRLDLDDLVDALVCLVTASYISAGQFDSLGNPEQRDARGLLMEIVACSPS
jgi:predicted RNase H-like nuclease